MRRPAEVACSRRDVLRGTAVGLALALWGWPLSARAGADAADEAVGEGLALLAEDDAQRLLAVARTLFPHDVLPDERYRPVVLALDARAAEDAELEERLRAGLSAIPADFRRLAVAEQESLLGRLQDTPFFRLVRDATVEELYGQPEVWEVFGYPGPSAPFGGYRGRGLADIDWLPEVSS